MVQNHPAVKQDETVTNTERKVEQKQIKVDYLPL